MFERKDCVVGAIISYGFLVMLFAIVHDKHKIDEPCNVDQPCVRFCCENSTNCKEKNIRENFNESSLKIYKFSNETKEFFILHGKPKCSMKLISEYDESQEWKFEYVSIWILNVRLKLMNLCY